MFLSPACSVKTDRHKEQLGQNCQTEVVKTLITPHVSCAPLHLWASQKKKERKKKKWGIYCCRLPTFIGVFRFNAVLLNAAHTPRGGAFRLPVKMKSGRVGGADAAHGRATPEERSAWQTVRRGRREQTRAAVPLAELCCFKHGHEKKEKRAHLQCLQLKREKKNKPGVFAPLGFGLVWVSRAIFGGETVSSWL